MAPLPAPPHPPLPDELVPFLPLVYVAWTDGVLSSEELRRIHGEIREFEPVSPEARDALRAWLDPDAPPSPSALEALRNRIRETLPSVWEGPPPGVEAAGELLGIPPEEALREILRWPSTAAPGKVAPPPTPSFDPHRLRAYLDADRLEIRDRVLALLHEPVFRIPRHLPKEEHRERVRGALERIAAEGLGSLAFPREYGGGGDPLGGLAVFETLACGDLSLMVKWGVQFGLWGGSVLQLGTERHHARLLPAIGSLELPGCYAMTELAHGSNVRELETTATWVAESGEFEIHTPSEGAVKEWIGNAAAHGRAATVFARLRVGGEDHGVHAFVVPLRDGDHRLLPGIQIEDCGWKAGLNGVDNGRIRFRHVRIPRENLLNRFADVTPDGEYTSPVPGSGKRFFTMLGTLVSGRASVAAAALMACRIGLAIAVRFSERRRQFGPAGAPEVPVMDYLVQQRLLLPRLADTWALTFAVRDLARRVATESAGGKEGAEVEGLAAGLKAVATQHAMETLQACREACGGQGYRADNRFGELRADVDVFTTFEGANPVLLQLLARGLLSRFRTEMGDLRLRGAIRLLTDRAQTRLAELNPVVTRRTDEAHLRDPAFHRGAFRYREDRLLLSAARRLRALLDSGVDSFEAMNRCQDHLVELARAHVDRVVLDRFHRAVVRAPTPGISETLGILYQLHALSGLERNRGWYLEAGYLEAGKSRAIRALVNRLCGEVREQAGFLVDAFGIPDALLAAPAALEPHGVRPPAG